VVRTRVGYAGGSAKDPTYYNLVDHSETIQIDFDPDQISYQDLLEVFWDSHNPVQPSYSSQYASFVFVHSPEQEQAARASKQREEVRRGRTLFTEIVPAEAFYVAEDYHQKYYLRQNDKLMAEFSMLFPDTSGFTNSTAVARANGYLGGNGSRAQVEDEIERLGLSPAGQQTLRELVR
jgi:peptide-methionine (S)-S-oxide reductase